MEEGVMHKFKPRWPILGKAVPDQLQIKSFEGGSAMWSIHVTDVNVYSAFHSSLFVVIDWKTRGQKHMWGPNLHRTNVIVLSQLSVRKVQDSATVRQTQVGQAKNKLNFCSVLSSLYIYCCMNSRYTHTLVSLVICTIICHTYVVPLFSTRKPPS